MAIIASLGLCRYVSPVTLDAIAGEGPVGLEEDGVLHAGVVHRTALQARSLGDSRFRRRL